MNSSIQTSVKIKLKSAVGQISIYGLLQITTFELWNYLE